MKDVIESVLESVEEIRELAAGVHPWTGEARLREILGEAGRLAFHAGVELRDLALLAEIREGGGDG